MLVPCTLPGASKLRVASPCTAAKCHRINCASPRLSVAAYVNAFPSFRYNTGTSNFRVAMYGCKHDASTFEALLQRAVSLRHLGCVSERFIDAACLVVRLLMSLRCL